MRSTAAGGDAEGVVLDGAEHHATMRNPSERHPEMETESETELGAGAGDGHGRGDGNGHGLGDANHAVGEALAPRRVSRSASRRAGAQSRAEPEGCIMHALA